MFSVPSILILVLSRNSDTLNLHPPLWAVKLKRSHLLMQFPVLHFPEEQTIVHGLRVSNASV